MDMGDIIIEEINYKAIIISLINAAIFLTTLSFTVYGFDHKNVGCWLPCIIISIIASISLIDNLFKAVKIKKMLTITRDGIIDDSSDSGFGYISYDDIKEFRILNIHNKKAIAVIPKDVDKFLSRNNMTKHKTVKRNINMDLPPVTIYVNRAKDIAAEDILTLLQKRLADIKRLED